MTVPRRFPGNGDPWRYWVTEELKRMEAEAKAQRKILRNIVVQLDEHARTLQGINRVLGEMGRFMGGLNRTLERHNRALDGINRTLEGHNRALEGHTRTVGGLGRVVETMRRESVTRFSGIEGKLDAILKRLP